MTAGARRRLLAAMALGLVATCGSVGAQPAPSHPTPPPAAMTEGVSPSPLPMPTPIATAKPAAASPSLQTLTGLPEATQTSEVIRVALVLTLLVLLPAIAICMTPFIRIVVVLSMIRHAFGMPETPPNQVLISLALFLTVFSMGPTLQAVNTDALQPFLAGAIPVNEAGFC